MKLDKHLDGHRDASVHASDVATRRLRQLSERNDTLARRAEALQGQVSRLDTRLQEALTDKQALEVYT